MPGDVPEGGPVFVISVAATLAGMHPQTLRQYDRMGLVSPGRTAGRGRRYSAHDINVLHEVQRLSQDVGINLAGIKRILQLQNRVNTLHTRLTELHNELQSAAAEVARREQEVHASYRRDLVPVEPSGPVVIWRGRHKSDG